MLSLTLFYPSTLAIPEIPKPDFSCLTRPQKEKIEICFQQNNQCHASMDKAAAPPDLAADITFYIGTFLLGGVAGIILYSQNHK